MGDDAAKAEADDWGEEPDFEEAVVQEELVGDDDDNEEADGAKAKTPAAASATDDDDDDDDDLDIDELDLDLDGDDYEEGVVEEEGGKKVTAEYQDDEEDWDEEDDALDDDWDEDEDGGDYPLEDDPDDPDYMRQKEIVEAAVATDDQKVESDSFDAMDFVMNGITEDQMAAMDQLPFMKDVAERAKGLEITESDVTSAVGDELSESVAGVSDLMDDPYPRHQEGEANILEQDVGVSDDDMEGLDDAYKNAKQAQEEDPWDKVMMKDLNGWGDVSNDTIAEMEDCLDEIGGSAYNVSRWLLYDLDYNVSNLILASVKHNREAPILFQHWYPQLVTYKRYQHARDRNFDFSWDDVENSDSTELEQYYAGFGYDQIPKKAPAETGIIGLEYLDEEEIKMAAFETWMREVYNPEKDRKDFDDDELRDEDNVFSKYYEAPQHPDQPSFDDAQSDIDEWRDDMGDDPATDSYRDMMGQSFEYNVKDETSDRDFRGNMVIACTGDDADLEIAEKITLRFKEDFGTQVFVETRVMDLAREEDNVYEIWLESYDIELLHSRKRATSNAKGWSGPAEIDDEQIDYLAKRVAFLISDDCRYSYRMEMEYVD